jgi:hypothetical protein
VARRGFGTDVVAELTTLCEKVAADFPQAVFFAGQMLFERDNWVLRMLHDRSRSQCSDGCIRVACK